MVLLILGASHTGKTALAQKLLERYHFPYLSIDHLKMGLIRSGQINLTPMSEDSELTSYLWPIVREMVKTAVENKQNLIVEGCYIPFDWADDFEAEYQSQIKSVCLVMSEEYIRHHFEDICRYANVIEHRLEDVCDLQQVLNDNVNSLRLAKLHNLPYIIIDEKYEIEFEV